MSYTVIFDVNGVLAHGNWELANNTYNPTDPLPIELIASGVDLLCRCAMSDNIQQVVALTNCTQEQITFLHKYFPEFMQLFDGIIAAGDLSWKKPDLKTFRFVIDAYRLDPAECIFIDDSALNTDAAEQLGFTSITYDDPEKVVEIVKMTGAIE
jgi:beta-phosphoglucomutase-like phosphatase (HAD superfamily)